MLDISVIVPLYNEEESLPELAAWIERVMNENNFTYEVIFVNDGSRIIRGKWSKVLLRKMQILRVFHSVEIMVNPPPFMWDLRMQTAR